jgi:hypothetical protein
LRESGSSIGIFSGIQHKVDRKQQTKVVENINGGLTGTLMLLHAQETQTYGEGSTSKTP